MIDREERLRLWTFAIVLWESFLQSDWWVIDDAKFTGDQPFGESLQATPNLRKDHLRR
jgi:hypothetical protein